MKIEQCYALDGRQRAAIIIYETINFLGQCLDSRHPLSGNFSIEPREIDDAVTVTLKSCTLLTGLSGEGKLHVTTELVNLPQRRGLRHGLRRGQRCVRLSSMRRLAFGHARVLTRARPEDRSRERAKVSFLRRYIVFCPL